MAIKVSKAQVGKAVDALIQYVGKQNEENTSLIEEEDFLYLVRGDPVHSRLARNPPPRSPSHRLARCLAH